MNAMRVATATVLVASLALASSDANADRPGPTPILVEAALLDAGRPVPACGRIHSIGVAQFQVQRVLRGSVQDRVIWVAFSCAAMARRDVGATFALRLQRGRPWASEAFFWPQGRPVRPLFFATLPAQRLR